MKHLSVSFLLAITTLCGCSEKPKNFSCSFVDAPKIMSSLSIKNAGATLNTQTFEATCKKVGNLTVYGATRNDCESYQNGGSHNILIFDEVIYKVSTVLQGNGALITEQYACNPVASQ